MYSRESLPNGAAVGTDHGDAPSRMPPPASSGFGSPGSDSTVKRIDLNDVLIRHQQATFVMRASGGSMVGDGIADGDVLLVDRAIRPSSGNVVIAVVEGEMVCRRYFRQGSETKLQASHAGTPDIVPGEGTQLEIWGVVTTAIKSLIG